MILIGRRRQWIVDRLQYRILFFNLFYFWLAVCGIGAAVFSGPILMLRDESAVAQHLEASQQLLALHQRFWPAALLICLLFIVHTTILSHRIAGPLYRFRLVLDSVRKGDLTARAKLRAADHLKADADAINRLVETLESQANRRTQLARALGASLAALREELDRRDLEAARARVEQLVAGAAELAGRDDRASPLDCVRAHTADTAGADQPVVSP